jgi:transcription-repair coupling factor (superfamily II helicase)
VRNTASALPSSPAQHIGQTVSEERVFCTYLFPAVDVCCEHFPPCILIFFVFSVIIMRIASTFDKIHKRLSAKKIFQPILSALSTQPTGIAVTSCEGSSKALLVGALYQHIYIESVPDSSSTIAIVAPHYDTAEEWFTDIKSLLPTASILFLAQETHRSALYDASDDALIMLTGQLAELDNTHHHQRRIIILTPDLLMIPLPPPERLSSHHLHLQEGNEYPFQKMIADLSANGFDRKDFVESIGDFAVRGGIIDVFFPGTDLPLRLEFFGDQLESIREFDPTSQRSIRELRTANVAIHVFHSTNIEGTSGLTEYLPKGTIMVYDNYPAISAVLVNAHHPVHATIDTQPYPTPTSVREVRHEADHEAFNIFTAFPALQSMSFVCINSLTSPTPVPSHQRFSLSAQAHIGIRSSIKDCAMMIHNNAREHIHTYICADGEEYAKRFAELLESVIENQPDSNDIPILPSDYTIIAKTLSSGFLLASAGICVLTEHEVFARRRYVRHRSTSTNKRMTLRDLQQLHRGDYLVHADKGIAQFDGLETITMGTTQQECIRLIFAGQDKMYVNLSYINRLYRYTSQEGETPKLTRLGTGEWARKKERTKKRIKDIARDLILLYAKRKSREGFAFPADTVWQKEMEATFMFEDTPDQLQCTNDVKDDMESPAPMDRLICGDVGFGKTEVAIRAAFKAVQSGKQVAVLVPTTILAEQHTQSFRDRLERYAVKVEGLSRFRTAAQQKEIIQRLHDGKVDIAIGTHRLLSKDVRWKELGLLVIDEEHRFGVSAKEKLRQISATVDTLTLTATPIPRTLNFSLLGARDISLMATPPRNRVPVKTEVLLWDSTVIEDALRREIQRGGQAFLVSDRISNLEELADKLRDMIPTIRIRIAHGQMSGTELEAIMHDVVERKADVLLATKIIESGIDIPNANTMFIYNAQNYGLAELYQLRGRVGRSNQQAYCYLMIPPAHSLQRNAIKRLQAIEEHTDLGSGYNLAMRDLEIRGAGNLLGGEQSGFITDIGFEMYNKIVEEAVHELKEQEFSEFFAERRKRSDHDDVLLPNHDMSIDIAGDALIPKHYVASDTERFELYKQLFSAHDQQSIDTVESMIRDRFGSMPEEVHRLFDAARIRVVALPLGFGNISIRSHLVCEFPPPEFAFFHERVLHHIIHLVPKMGGRLVPKGAKVFAEFPVSSVQEVVGLLQHCAEELRSMMHPRSEEHIHSFDHE